MKYKEGDSVKIKSKDWYDYSKKENGDVEAGGEFFVDLMAKYCGMDAVITRAYTDDYSLDIDEGKFYWTDEIFE